MAAIVLDFAWSKPSVAQLKAANVAAVGMYVSHDATKNANLSLVRAYAAAGIKSFLFFEDTAKRALGGYAAGKTDAEFAYRTAAGYGKPAWAPIAPAMDFDVPDFAPKSSDPMAKLGPVGQYAKAWHDYNRTHGIKDDAAYGDFYLMKRLAAAELMTIGIQTVAWSGGQIDLADIALLQIVQQMFGIADVEIIESVKLLTRLAWVPGEKDPIVPVVRERVPHWHERIAEGQLSLVDFAREIAHEDVASLLGNTLRHYGHFDGPTRAYVNGLAAGTVKPTDKIKGAKFWIFA